MCTVPAASCTEREASVTGEAQLRIVVLEALVLGIAALSKHPSSPVSYLALVLPPNSSATATFSPGTKDMDPFKRRALQEGIMDADTVICLASATLENHPDIKVGCVCPRAQPIA